MGSLTSVATGFTIQARQPLYTRPLKTRGAGKRRGCYESTSSTGSGDYWEPQDAKKKLRADKTLEKVFKQTSILRIEGAVKRVRSRITSSQSNPLISVSEASDSDLRDDSLADVSAVDSGVGSAGKPCREVGEINGEVDREERPLKKVS